MNGGDGSRPHEIERAVGRLNAWFAENKYRVPRCFSWRSFRRQRRFPIFKAVRTTAIADWSVEELDRLFRVRYVDARNTGAEVEVPIELVVTDKAVSGTFLDVRALMDAAWDVFAARHLFGKVSPRLWWFWLHRASLTAEIETYVTEIRLRVDASTPVKHDQSRVFEEFRVPLRNGQQTAIGRNCFFVLECVQPQGSATLWRFSVTQDGQVLIGPHLLQPKPIYHDNELLAVIKQVSDDAVILSVLASPGGGSG